MCVYIYIYIYSFYTHTHACFQRSPLGTHRKPKTKLHHGVSILVLHCEPDTFCCRLLRI